ncbi:MAG: hypothetical protein GC192_10895 [Bacteroidetes bacterium]|nr:hypothetical protein [Bacteroidota bacterium]
MKYKTENNGLLFMPPNSKPTNPMLGGTAASQPLSTQVRGHPTPHPNFLTNPTPHSSLRTVISYASLAQTALSSSHANFFGFFGTALSAINKVLAEESGKA